MNRILVILVAVSLLALLTVGCGESSPSGTLKSFLKAVDDDDYSKARSCMTSEAAEELTPGLFNEAVAMCDEEEGIKQVSIIDEEITGDTAEVQFEIEFNSGFTDEATAYLVKDNGKWKLPEF
jgi:hypothetical protein